MEITKTTEEILKIAKSNGLTADDLFTEAECVAEYGEWTHMCLLGYRAEALETAAKLLLEKEPDNAEGSDLDYLKDVEYAKTTTIENEYEQSWNHCFYASKALLNLIFTKQCPEADMAAVLMKVPIAGKKSFKNIDIYVTPAFEADADCFKNCVWTRLEGPAKERIIKKLLFVLYNEALESYMDIMEDWEGSDLDKRTLMEDDNMEKMTYDEFKKLIKDLLPEYLSEIVKDYTCEMESVSESVAGKSAVQITVLKPDKITPHLTTYLFLEDMWKEMDVSGMGRDKCIRSLANSLAGLIKNIEYMEGLQFDKNKVVLEVINRKQNEEILKAVPYRTFLDLAVTYRLVERADDELLQSVRITNEYLDAFSLTEEELFQLAVQNTPKLLPLKIENMIDILKRVPDFSMDELREFDEERVQVIMDTRIISNEYSARGAGYLLYADVFHNLAEELQSDLYVCPASVHDLVVMKAEKDANMSIVEMVNATSVPFDDRLSNQVYYYSRTLKNIFIVSHNKEAIV